MEHYSVIDRGQLYYFQENGHSIKRPISHVFFLSYIKSTFTEKTRKYREGSLGAGEGKRRVPNSMS